MGSFGFTQDRANIATAGINTWKLQGLAGAGQVGWADLGPLSNGSVLATLVSGPDTRQRQRPWAISFAAQARILGTEKATLLLLAKLAGSQNLHSIKCSGGDPAFSGLFGTHWKFVCEGDMTADRYIELSANHTVLGDHATLDDWNSIRVPQTDVDPSDPADYLYGLAPTLRKPAGFENVWVRNTDESNWELPGAFRNCRMVIESVDYVDPKLRQVAYLCDVAVEFDLTQTAEENDLLVPLGWAELGYKIELADGTFFTFPLSLGVNWVHHNDKDNEDVRFTRITGTGRMGVSDLVACIS
jgi:hypothetical protein